MNRNIIFVTPEGRVYVDILGVDGEALLKGAETLVEHMGQAADASTAMEINNRMAAVERHGQRLDNLRAQLAQAEAFMAGEKDRLLSLQDRPVPEERKAARVHARDVARAINMTKRRDDELASLRTAVAQVEADLAEAQAAMTGEKLEELRDGATRFKAEKSADLDRLRKRLASDVMSREWAATLKERAMAEHQAGLERGAKGDGYPGKPLYLDLEPVAFDVADLPDFHFQAAWRWDRDAGRITVDMQAAIEQQREALRWQRYPALRALDIEVLRAMENGEDTGPFIKRKQAMRDVTDHPDLVGATDLNKLKSLTVASLTGDDITLPQVRNAL